MYYIPKQDFLPLNLAAPKLRAFIEKKHSHLSNTLRETICDALTSEHLHSISEITVNNEDLICKTNTLKHRNEKIRATLGISRRGTYDWPIAEIINSINLKHLDYVPNIIAFGYRLNAIGVVQSTVLLTEYINNSLTVEEYIKLYPENIWPCIQVALIQIIKCASDNFIHLDLWIGNILVNHDLSKSWVIDVEYCRLNSKASVESQIGHCIGYLFWYGLSEHIELKDYLAFCNNFIKENKLINNTDETLKHLTYAATHEIKRKKKLDIF